MKNKKILLLILAVLLVCFMAATAVSCSFINKILGKSETIVPVTVESVELLKDIADYTESQEYLYNTGKGYDMGIESGGDFIISITYNNPKNYAISYVTVNADKIMPSKFEEGSGKTNTKILFTAPEADEETEVVYTLKNIFYNTGSETKKIVFDEGMQTEYKIVVAPEYKLTLNYQNADRRSTSQKAIDDVSQPTTVDFGAEMSTVSVFDKDYANPTGLPIKEGGWVFEGWFTEPNGQGIAVSATDKYYFWTDITLYAYYTRLFEFEIVELETPIEHSYTGYVNSNGVPKLVSGTKTFTSGVIITKDNSRGQYPYMNIGDTIVDEQVTVSESGRVSVTASEYPVVSIGKQAFMDVNNITELTIGKYVERIEYAAFDNCNKLAKVTFNEGCVLKYIGDFAFQDTKMMGITSSFTLPSQVQYLGNWAFRYSGWSNTNNNGINESVLHIYPQYTFIGVGCFFETGFSTVVFEPGCHFESQITSEEGLEMEKNSGWKEINAEVNRIGANIFGNCKKLTEIRFLSNDGESDALNIIPDKAFDAGQYTVAGVERLTLSEGIQYIGKEAFNYQTKLPFLEIPASVIDIGKKAFYNCTAISSLTFKEGSKLEVLHSECFGNMSGIDRVIIVSDVFRKYGNGPFSGCDRLKSIEFPNINDPLLVPMGFHKDENKDEVLPQHYYSDLMYGTFETGSSDSGTGSDGELNTGNKSSYSLPTRVFCKNTVMERFKESLLNGKEMYIVVDGKEQSTGRNIYNNVIFVHNIDLIKTYVNPTALPNEDAEVQIALQEIYDVSTKKPVAYSIVYWSYRSKNITLPSSIEGLQYPITELAMYALPTSVVELTIPSNITRLEHDALNGCVNLETIKFEDKNTLTYVGDFAFFGTKITSFEAGTSLKVIGMNAFMQCKALRWVDLGDAAITNPPVNGREERLRYYKYAYEIEDGDETDRSNVLYDGSFQGCTALEWVKLPTGLKQISNGLFAQCTSLRTVIIPSVGISDSTSQTDDYTFYYRSLPTAAYDAKAIPFMTIYVPDTELDTHKIIFPQGNYKLITDAPSHG